MLTTLRKILAAVSFAVFGALVSVPAHANMDFAMGLATGATTGSAMSMAGAQIHQSMQDDEVAQPARRSGASMQEQGVAQAEAQRQYQSLYRMFMLMLAGIFAVVWVIAFKKVWFK